MSMSISKKLILITLLAILLPAIIGGKIIYREVSDNVAFTKLNDLMNIIDARYIHVLDFLKQQEFVIDQLATEHHLHQELLRYYQRDANTSSREQNDVLKKITDYLHHIKEASILDRHAMKEEKESGTSLKQVFGRDVKWDIYRLDERLYRIHELLLLDDGGKVISSTNPNSLGLDLGEDSLFVEGRKARFVKDVYQDHDGSASMAFASPVVEEADFAKPSYVGRKMLGVIVLKVNTDFLTDLMTGDIGNQIGGKLFFAGYTPSTDFYMINKEGYMITQSKVLNGTRDTVLKQQSKTIPWKRCVDESIPVREAQEFYVNYDGIEVGGASMCVFDLKWTMVVEQNKDEILTLFTSIERTMSIVGLSMAAAITLLLFFMTRRVIINPINRLSDATEQIKSGNYDVRVAPDSVDEIGRLGVSFNGMAEDIQRSTQALVKNNLELEDRVRWRTKELSEANQTLSLEIEQRELAQKEAENANQAKSSFLANISHELRTPMHGILSFSQLGADRVGSVEKEKLEKYFHNIHDSGKRLLTLLNDLLDISKLEAGHMEFEFEEDRLSNAVDICINEFKALANKKDIQLVVEELVGDDRGCFDKNRMIQVIRNLLSNAIKFSPEGQSVLVKYGEFASENTGESKLRFSVIDHGVGIPDDELDTIFDKFVQSSKAKNIPGGTGLGLAICKEIIERHGGEIDVRNNVEGGATFTFVIPVKAGNRQFTNVMNM